jgi:hypothetical protein
MKGLASSMPFLWHSENIVSATEAGVLRIAEAVLLCRAAQDMRERILSYAGDAQVATEDGVSNL